MRGKLFANQPHRGVSFHYVRPGKSLIILVRAKYTAIARAACETQFLATSLERRPQSWGPTHNYAPPNTPKALQKPESCAKPNRFARSIHGGPDGGEETSAGGRWTGGDLRPYRAAFLKFPAGRDSQKARQMRPASQPACMDPIRLELRADCNPLWRPFLSFSQNPSRLGKHTNSN